MKKILTSLLNLLKWVNSHTPETFFIIVYVCSLLPFFINIAHPALLGGLMSFGAMGFFFFAHEGKSEKDSRLYSILGLSILVLACGNMFDFSFIPLVKFFDTYAGAMMGMVSGAMIFGMMQEHKEGRERERRIERKNTIKRISIPENASAFVTASDKIPVRSCDGERIVGHISKPEYNEFIYKNIVRENE